MLTITGQTKTGKDRVLEVERRGELVYLWIHTPGDDSGGYEILVSAAELEDVLGRET